MCDQAPAALVTDAGEQPRERLLGKVTVERLTDIIRGGDPGPTPARPTLHQPPSELQLLHRIGRIDPESLDEYRRTDGYRALERALAIGPDAVIAEVTASKLVGGAAPRLPEVRRSARSPRGRYCMQRHRRSARHVQRIGSRWKAIRSQWLTMTIWRLPPLRHGYFTSEAIIPSRSSPGTIAQSRHQLIGSNILGSALSFEIEFAVAVAPTSVATALFESIEGKPGEPRNKIPRERWALREIPWSTTSRRSSTSRVMFWRAARRLRPWERRSRRYVCFVSAAQSSGPASTHHSARHFAPLSRWRAVLAQAGSLKRSARRLRAFVAR
jgi:NADH-quinone oxidoreductase subunit F